MKIAFYRVLNSSLPEPYPDLKSDILYLTDRGYVYEEGNNVPIDIFDVNFIQYITNNPKTEINLYENKKIDRDILSPATNRIINQHKDLLSYIIKVRYASVKNCGLTFGTNKATAKETLEILERQNILSRYGSFYIIADKYKEVIQDYLKKEGV